MSASTLIMNQIEGVSALMTRADYHKRQGEIDVC